MAAILWHSLLAVHFPSQPVIVDCGQTVCTIHHDDLVMLTVFVLASDSSHSLGHSLVEL